MGQAYTRRIGQFLGLVGAIGIGAFANPAHAGPSPTCTESEPYYANVAKGDVVVWDNSGVDPLLASILDSTGQDYGHVAMIDDSAGSYLKQSSWSGTPPGEGTCALPLDVYGLKNLSPGIKRVNAYGQNVKILSGASTNKSCKSASSKYKLSSYGNRVTNGNCAAYLHDSCYVPSNSDTITVGTAVEAVYAKVKQLVASQVGWKIGFFCGGITADEMGERGAMQVLNEIFYAKGDQNFNFMHTPWIYWPDAGTHAPANWPQTVSPGPTPDGIYDLFKATHATSKIKTGKSVTTSYDCTCPWGYAFDAATFTCVAPKIEAVVDWSTGKIGEATRGSYIEIYGSGFQPNNNAVTVFLGNTTLSVTYKSATQVNAFVPTSTSTGSQSLQLAVSNVGSAYATVLVK